MPYRSFVCIILVLVIPLPAAAAGQLSENAIADIRTLSSEAFEGRETGTEGAKKAREYLLERYRQIGLEPVGGSYFQPFTYRRGRAEGVNVLGKLPGCQHPEQLVVVTAHYDHLGMKGGQVHPGADDNASGVAAMLMLAEQLQIGSQGCSPALSWLFLATDAEENGLNGSQAFIDQPPVALERVILNLNLDMIARGEQRNHLYLTRGRDKRGLQNHLKAIDGPVNLRLLRHRGPGQGRRSALRSSWPQSSDHGPFHRAGIEYLFFGGMDHADYHRPSDTWDRIEADFLQGSLEIILAAARWIDANSGPRDD